MQEKEHVGVEVEIRIRTHGSAFEGDTNAELARVLKSLADYISVYGAHTGLTARDVNGNVCGMVVVKLA